MAVELNLQQLEDVSAQCSASGLATVLRIEFAFDATGQARQALILECPDAIRRFGRIEATHSAKWTASPRQAEAIGRAILSGKARPSWAVQAQLSPIMARRLMPGDDVVLAHPWLPSGTALVTDLEEQPLAMTATLTARMAAGDAPDITLTRQAGSFAPLGSGGVSVDYKNGVATLTIVDDTSRPLAGAKVTLDGSKTRVTDSKGQVQFTTARGIHPVAIDAMGYAPMEMDVAI
jgi:hypothetical protein